MQNAQLDVPRVEREVVFQAAQHHATGRQVDPKHLCLDRQHVVEEAVGFVNVRVDAAVRLERGRRPHVIDMGVRMDDRSDVELVSLEPLPNQFEIASRVDDDGLFSHFICHN